VSIVLSEQQAPLYKAAIADHRKLEAILHQMRQRSAIASASNPFQASESAAEKIIQKPPYLRPF
jgi:hypothetical protein